MDGKPSALQGEEQPVALPRTGRRPVNHVRLRVRHRRLRPSRRGPHEALEGEPVPLWAVHFNVYDS